MATAFQFPGLLHLFPTPGAVAHEGHQRSSAAFPLALRDVALVRIGTATFLDESRPIAKCTIVPVVLDATLAARAT